MTPLRTSLSGSATGIVYTVKDFVCSTAVCRPISGAMVGKNLSNDVFDVPTLFFGANGGDDYKIPLAVTFEWDVSTSETKSRFTSVPVIGQAGQLQRWSPLPEAGHAQHLVWVLRSEESLLRLPIYGDLLLEVPTYYYRPDEVLFDPHVYQAELTTAILALTWKPV